MNRRPGVSLIVLAAASQLFGGSALAAPSPASSDRAQLQALEKRYLAGFDARNATAIMANYAPGAGVFVFDAVPPRQYAGSDAYRKDWQALFAAFPGPVTTQMTDLSLTIVGPVAYGHNIQSTEFTGPKGTKTRMVVRVTDVYRKTAAGWKIVQEHVSFPVDVTTGKADLLSKP